VFENLVVVVVDVGGKGSGGIHFKSACHFAAKRKDAFFRLAGLEVLHAALYEAVKRISIVPILKS